MSDVRVDALSGERDLRGFLRLPRRVYGRDRFYSLTGEKALISQLHREAFIGNQQILVARKGDAVCARCVARVSSTLSDDAGRPYGMLGFFEALNDADAVRALFDAATEWLRGRGVGIVIGPMDGDTWHKYRLNIGPFVERPFLMEPYNREYYPALWEAYGFSSLESYYSLKVDDLRAAAGGTERIAARTGARGYRIRRLDMQRFHDELDLIYDLTCRIFSENFLYTAISREAFLSLYDGVNALLDPELVTFAQSPEGADIGFLFAVPDNWRAVAAMRGRKTPVALLKFLCLRGRTRTVNIKTLGVLPEYQRTGVALQLMHDAYRTALGKGFESANLCLIREGNPSGRMDGGQGRVLRRYRLFQLPLQQGLS